MEHFFDENAHSYGVKETLDKNGIIRLREKVAFKNRDLDKLIDKLIKSEVRPGENREKTLVMHYMDPSNDDGIAPSVRYIGIDTSKLNYLIYKTPEARDKYYNTFN